MYNHHPEPFALRGTDHPIRRACNAAIMALAAGVFGLWASALPAAQEFWVGPGSDNLCDFDSLSDAVDQAGDGDILRLSRAMTYTDGPYFIGDSIELVGGYERCEGAHTGLQSQLDGQGGSVLLIENSSRDLQVELRFLEVFNARMFGPGPGLRITGDHDVTLVNSLFRENAAFDSPGGDNIGNGGAISIENGAHLWIRGVNMIRDNEAASDGGGIYCTGNSSLRFDQGSSVLNNEAFGNGGGIAVDSCDVDFKAGGFQNTGLVGNHAREDGGGLYAAGAGQIELNGVEVPGTHPDAPVTVRGNSADGTGGGIAVGGDFTKVTLTNVFLEDNEATRAAALSAIGAEVDVTIRNDRDAPCDGQQAQGQSRTCSKIRGNEGGSGVVMAFAGASLYIHHTEIVDNHISIDGQSVGEIIRLSGNTLVLSNSLIAGNTSDKITSMVKVDRGEAFLNWSTIAQHQGPVHADTLIHTTASSGFESSISLEGLVIDQPETDVLQFAGQGEVELTRAACLLAHDLNSIEDQIESTTYTIHLVEGSPDFVDAAGGNFRLEPNSAGVDVCERITESLLPVLWPPSYDIDGNPRGTPESDQSESTPFDLGAYERVDSGIFRDRFEQ